MLWVAQKRTSSTHSAQSCFSCLEAAAGGFKIKTGHDKASSACRRLTCPLTLQPWLIHYSAWVNGNAIGAALIADGWVFSIQKCFTQAEGEHVFQD